MDGSSNIIPFRAREERPEPPHNVEAEQALLGALLYRNTQYSAVADLVTPECFSYAVHGRIFEVMGRFVDEGRVADPVTLKAAFEGDSALLPLGGAAYLVRLATSMVGQAQVPEYARLIRELHDRRQLMQAGDDLISDAAAVDIDRPASVIADEHEQKVYEIAERKKGGGGLVPLARHLDTAEARLAKAIESRGKCIGVPSGLVDLDRFLGGFMPGELYILAGRPGMGKSTVAKTIALNAARAGFRVPYYSTEMPGATLATWFVADVTGISAERVRRGDLDPHEFDAWKRAAANLRPIGVHIDETPGITIAKMRDRARRMQRKGGIGMLVVDHLGHMSASRAKATQGRTAEVTEISNGLLGIAKELDIPVLALSQLNRGVEGRDDKRPTLADLRDSGSLEQDADTVIFAYRPEYYLDRNRPERKLGEKDDRLASREADWHAEMDRVKGITELIFAKRRSGPIDTIRVKFDPERSRVTNLAQWGGQ
jgi:replicative DNA helicase